MAVYVLVYDRAPYFLEFMKHKGTTFGTSQVPYTRYHADGRYLGSSNCVSKRRFLSWLGH